MPRPYNAARGEPYKRSKRNQANGYGAEDYFERRMRNQGRDLVRAGWGSDYVEKRGGRTLTHEVKYGTSALTPKQKKIKKARGSSHKIHRVVKKNGRYTTITHEQARLKRNSNARTSYHERKARKKGKKKSSRRGRSKMWKFF